MKKKNEYSPDRYLGIFSVLMHDSLIGELKLEGERTNLRIHSSTPIDTRSVVHATGLSYSGKHITLIDCIGQDASFSLNADGTFLHYADIFPHHVAIGSHHLNPEANCIKSISFKPKDICSIFPDRDAFGFIFDGTPHIHSLVEHRQRPVAIGDHPHVIYFAGRYSIFEANTAIGKISIQHRPSFDVQSPSGAHVRNHMTASIEFEAPVNFTFALESLQTLNCFFSVVAGRIQGIKNTEINASIEMDGIPQTLSLTSSYRTKTSAKGRFNKPHPGDIPINPISKYDEFKKVIVNWISRHKTWSNARWRYIGCLDKGNSYDIDRLVAAANLFDLLPPDATPAPSSIPEQLETARLECKKIFRKLPASVDRNSILNALGRVGKPSLPKKVNFRVSLIDPKMGKHFPELSFAATIGVRLRNYFVHGSLDGLAPEKIIPLMPFLTDVLEFVFSASDLIEAGWDPEEWLITKRGFGHAFSRLSMSYHEHLDELKNAVNQ